MTLFIADVILLAIVIFFLITRPRSAGWSWPGRIIGGLLLVASVGDVALMILGLYGGYGNYPYWIAQVALPAALLAALWAGTKVRKYRGALIRWALPHSSDGGLMAVSRWLLWQYQWVLLSVLVLVTQIQKVSSPLIVLGAVSIGVFYLADPKAPPRALSPQKILRRYDRGAARKISGMKFLTVTIVIVLMIFGLKFPFHNEQLVAVQMISILLAAALISSGYWYLIYRFLQKFTFTNREFDVLDHRKKVAQESFWAFVLFAVAFLPSLISTAWIVTATFSVLLPLAVTWLRLEAARRIKNPQVDSRQLSVRSRHPQEEDRSAS